MQIELDSLPLFEGTDPVTGEPQVGALDRRLKLTAEKTALSREQSALDSPGGLAADKVNEAELQARAARQAAAYAEYAAAEKKLADLKQINEIERTTGELLRGQELRQYTAGMGVVGDFRSSSDPTYKASARVIGGGLPTGEEGTGRIGNKTYDFRAANAAAAAAPFAQELTSLTAAFTGYASTTSAAFEQAVIEIRNLKGELIEAKREIQDHAGQIKAIRR